MSGSAIPPRLVGPLQESYDLGLLGPGPIVDQVRHAGGFATVAAEVGADLEGWIADLGSGGGIPGLVLAELWPTAHLVLLDAAERRCAFLERAVEAAGWTGRVEVQRGRAEELGRLEALRGRFTVVVARSFGPPGVTAECAAPLLAPGGWLIVSEPPEQERTEQRWPSAGLAELGFSPAEVHATPHRFVALQLQSPCGDRYPRRVGIPTKRPLF